MGRAETPARPGLHRWIPFVDAGGRRGIALVFSAMLVAYLALVLVRAGVWHRMSDADRAVAATFAALLYLFAVRAGRAGAAPSSVRGRLESDRTAMAALVVLAVMAACAAAAPFVAAADPTAVTAPALTRYQPPTLAHLMGTDRFGRDMWARVAYGARASFGVCSLSVALAVLLGTAVGASAGVAGRRVDDLLMRFVDGMLSFPRLLLLLAVVAFLPPGVLVLAPLIGLTSWMGVARVVRGEVRRMRGREFVEAAVATGVGRGRLLARHMMPNAIGHVAVAATLNAGTVILLESSLSFLGLGVQPPTPSWGAMVFDGRDALGSAWWVSAFPAAAIALAVVALNLLGDGLRDALDARTAANARPGFQTRGH